MTDGRNGMVHPFVSQCSFAAHTAHRCEKSSVIAVQELSGERRLIPFCAEHFKMFADDFVELLRRAGVEVRRV